MGSPVVSTRKSNIPLIVVISLGMGLCCASITLIVVAVPGLLLLDFSAITG